MTLRNLAPWFAAAAVMLVLPFIFTSGSAITDRKSVV